MTWRYALGAALALSLLEVVLSSSAATGRVGSALSGIADASKYLLSPAYPLVPDRSSASTSSTTASVPDVTTGPPSLPGPLPYVPGIHTRLPILDGISA